MVRTTTLSEFTDGADEDTDVDAAGDDPPTTAENAEDIRHLIGLVGQLTEQVGDVVDRLEQHDPETAESTERRPADATTERMFH